MTTDTVPQTVLFPDLFDKPLVAKFNQEQASSDGGAILLKAAERVYGLVKAFARCLSDKRAPEKIRHTLADLIGQRIFGIACGHPDCNDAEHLADDPIHKLLLGRDPVAGESLASQPTLSRFENAAGRGALYDMGCELAARVVERHRRQLGRVRRITIDLDPTDDPTHGAQQYSLFNGYYDNWCYLPLLAFLTFDREPEQYLCSAVLRHGKAVASEGGVALLARLLPLLRCAFPRARFLVRLDGGFASPALCVPGAVRLPGCTAAARLRGGDGEQGAALLRWRPNQSLRRRRGRRQLDPSRRGEERRRVRWPTVLLSSATDGGLPLVLARFVRGLSTHQGSGCPRRLRTSATAAKCHRGPVDSHRVADQMPTGPSMSRRRAPHAASPLPRG